MELRSGSVVGGFGSVGGTRARARLGAVGLAGAALLAACGGGASTAPGTHSAGDVQKSGMSQTFAGKNKCDATGHARPFVIEWDATDTSTFEARAKDDVLFVRYEGCDLQVLDGCRNESVHGQLGSYRNVEWTSGSVEVMEIQNEGELYAKLPLGVNALAGRVQGGEKFRMEYFVAGTRTATRDTIYRSDLDAIPACKGATHFVHAYNLGAFALGADTHTKGEVGGTVWGVGVGGSKASSQKAEKTGGVLASCRAEGARETETCKTPIRLALRAIDDGTNPDQVAATMPETPSAANLAGKLKAETDKEKRAAAHLDQAQLKSASRDGKGCLAELDQHDKLDPRPLGLSTNTKSRVALLRAQCLMSSGQCDAGKTLYRRAFEATAGDSFGPEHLDKATDGAASMFCQGTGMSARDRVQKASMELNMAAYSSKRDAPYCLDRVKVLRDALPTLKPRDADDAVIVNAPAVATNAGVACLARAGDCDAAWKLYRELDAPKVKEALYANSPTEERERQQKYLTMTAKLGPADREKIQRSTFEAIARQCKK